MAAEAVTVEVSVEEEATEVVVEEVDSAVDSEAAEVSYPLDALCYSSIS